MSYSFRREGTEGIRQNAIFYALVARGGPRYDEAYSLFLLPAKRGMVAARGAARARAGSIYAMYLSRLIVATAVVTGQSSESVRRSVKAFLELVRAYLSKGQKVKLTGFGAFAVRQRKARRVINPQTGKAMILPPRRVVRFVPAGRLRRSVR
jgi:DNA-binding protein HU-beta